MPFDENKINRRKFLSYGATIFGAALMGVNSASLNGKAFADSSPANSAKSQKDMGVDYANLTEELKLRFWQGEAILHQDCTGQKDIVELEKLAVVSNMAVYNTVIRYSPGIQIGDNCSFTNCDFICTRFISGTSPAISVCGENIFFQSCTFTGVPVSTTQLMGTESAFNVRYLNCRFDGSFKNP